MMLHVTEDPYAVAAASAASLTALAGRPDVAVVLGSGWAPAADAIGPAEAEVPLTELGGFPAPTVAGHTPTVRSVSAGPLRVLVFLGRVHLYEGLPPATVVHGVRTAVLAGARVVVLTNAAGGIRSGLTVGEPVLISDHLNLTGKSPLTGPAPSVGQRFVDLTDLYSPRLRALAREADPSLAEGVYAMLPGPHYETPAEITMLGRLGAEPGRDVDRPGGDRRPSARGRGARHLAGHEPGRGPGRAWPEPCRGGRRPAGPRPAGWAPCWPRPCPASSGRVQAGTWSASSAW